MDIAAQTRGKAIPIAGKTIQLPPDAYVESVAVSISCLRVDQQELPCPEVPAYVIVRGNLRINVGQRTGRINSEDMPPNEEHLFDFLKEALR